MKLLAADGKTDIYGQIFRPSDFSPDQSYPVVSHVFSTPELPWTAKGSFSNSMFLGLSYFDAAALAELGFIVVQIDGRLIATKHSMTKPMVGLRLQVVQPIMWPGFSSWRHAIRIWT